MVFLSTDHNLCDILVEQRFVVISCRLQTVMSWRRCWTQYLNRAAQASCILRKKQKIFLGKLTWTKQIQSTSLSVQRYVNFVLCLLQCLCAQVISICVLHNLTLHLSDSSNIKTYHVCQQSILKGQLLVRTRLHRKVYW